MASHVPPFVHDVPPPQTSSVVIYPGPSHGSFPRAFSPRRPDARYRFIPHPFAASESAVANSFIPPPLMHERAHKLLQLTSSSHPRSRRF